MGSPYVDVAAFQAGHSAVNIAFLTQTRRDPSEEFASMPCFAIAEPLAEVATRPRPHRDTGGEFGRAVESGGFQLRRVTHVAPTLAD